MKIGKDTVVIGNVSPNTEVGDGSVVIGPIDANGNTIINQPMAVGRNAQAGPISRKRRTNRYHRYKIPTDRVIRCRYPTTHLRFIGTSLIPCFKVDT